MTEPSAQARAKMSTSQTERYASPEERARTSELTKLALARVPRIECPECGSMVMKHHFDRHRCKPALKDPRDMKPADFGEEARLHQIALKAQFLERDAARYPGGWKLP